MTGAPNAAYLESKILTASPAHLHRMLLEAAWRHGQRALQLWEDEAAADQVDECLGRLIDIAEELVLSASRSELPLARSLEEQYAFLFRELAACQLNRQLAPLIDSVRLLQYHRDTWKQVCQQLDGEAQTPAPTPPAPRAEAPNVENPPRAAFSADA